MGHEVPPEVAIRLLLSRHQDNLTRASYAAGGASETGSISGNGSISIHCTNQFAVSIDPPLDDARSDARRNVYLEATAACQELASSYKECSTTNSHDQASQDSGGCFTRHRTSHRRQTTLLPNLARNTTTQP